MRAAFHNRPAGPIGAPSAYRRKCLQRALIALSWPRWSRPQAAAARRTLRTRMRLRQGGGYSPDRRSLLAKDMSACGPEGSW